MENWRTICYKEIPSVYMINREGIIVNSKTGYVIKPWLDKDGYLVLNLHFSNADYQYKTCKVHREVAKAFIPNPNNLPVVHHKDHNRANPCVDNLEWVTGEYNTKEAHLTGCYTYVKGFDHGMNKYELSQIAKVCEMLIIGGYSYSEISKETGVSEQTIASIYLRKQWIDFTKDMEFADIKYTGHKKYKKHYREIDDLIRRKVPKKDIRRWLSNITGVEKRKHLDSIIERRMKKVKEKLVLVI